MHRINSLLAATALLAASCSTTSNPTPELRGADVSTKCVLICFDGLDTGRILKVDGQAIDGTQFHRLVLPAGPHEITYLSRDVTVLSNAPGKRAYSIGAGKHTQTRTFHLAAGKSYIISEFDHCCNLPPGIRLEQTGPSVVRQTERN